jgi:hypothetical protein
LVLKSGSRAASQYILQTSPILIYTLFSQQAAGVPLSVLIYEASGSLREFMLLALLSIIILCGLCFLHFLHHMIPPQLHYFWYAYYCKFIAYQTLRDLPTQSFASMPQEDKPLVTFAGIGVPF